MHNRYLNGIRIFSKFLQELSGAKKIRVRQLSGLTKYELDNLLL